MNRGSKTCGGSAVCPCCIQDLKFLRQRERPAEVIGVRPLRIVDLFSGCGGMTLGLWEAARRLGRAIDIPLAVDSDPAVLQAYAANFPLANTVAGDVNAVLRDLASHRYGDRLKALSLDAIDVLVGGPPCQGHSGLNNHTRHDDPKNSLYLSMAKAAALFRPKVIIIENVPSVRRDRAGVVDRTRTALEALGYAWESRVLDLLAVGVPQHRRRFIAIATRDDGIDLAALMDDLADKTGCSAQRSVRWAVEDLALAVDETDSFDSPSTPSVDNVNRIDFMIKNGLYDLPNDLRPPCHRDKDHSYLSVYGRLHWDRPAQTITTGFCSMGQGRFVHPSEPRTITPHEAARIQTFPDWFDFRGLSKRGQMSRAIGNAVPPFLTIAIGGRLFAGGGSDGC
ncbi:MAG: DNA (cytosine-5-)-methyltransferase [Acidobacteria bacterium]|nr:DNA (cytosine-5-)-methyltransferase [Acidobacteriota bacterium]